MSAWLSFVAVAALAILSWVLYRRFASDRLSVFTERRRTSSRTVSRGEFVDGNRHLAVALAVTDSMFFFENSDLEASLDLQWVGEVEYDNELATGASVDTGKVLRLRCYSQTFEFVLPQNAVAQWEKALPARRLSDGVSPMVAAAAATRLAEAAQ